MITFIPIKNLRTDGGTQPRLEIKASVVRDFVAAIVAGRNIPPLVAFYDGSHYWLADGFHRLAAYERGNIEWAKVDRRTGTVRDAILFSIGANLDQGIQRDRREKRHAVERLLNDPEWSTKSNGWIAKHCHCRESYVRYVKLARKKAIDGRNTTTVDNTGDVKPGATHTGLDGKRYPAHLQSWGTDQQRHTIAERIAALPLGKVLSQFEHAGQLFQCEAALWYEYQSLIETAQQLLSTLPQPSDPISRALAALAAIPDPKHWQLCPVCKGCGRANHNNAACSNCDAGFTTHPPTVGSKH